MKLTLDYLLSRYGRDVRAITQKFGLTEDSTLDDIFLVSRKMAKALHKQRPLNRKRNRDRSHLVGARFGTMLCLGELNRGHLTPEQSEYPAVKLTPHGRMFEMLCDCGYSCALPAPNIRASMKCPVCGGGGECRGVGNRYGRLVVVAIPNNRRMRTCKCDCGNIVVVWASNLSGGLTKSCGCLRRTRQNETQPLIHGHDRGPDASGQ